MSHTEIPRAPVSAEASLDVHRLDPDGGFVVSTGLECSAPVIAGGIRQDELHLTDHWRRVEEDSELVADFGIRHLRYGIPFHVVAAEAGRFDWDWTDRAMEALQRAGVEPIADMLHFGLPDDLWGFGDDRLVGRYLDFIEAFVVRYPWVRRFTPINEPLISARFSALEGWWNEGRTDLPSFVAALANVVECVVEAMRLVRSRVDAPVFIQSDVCESFVPAEAAAVERVAALNAARFVTFDMTYGRMPDPAVCESLVANGLDVQRLERLVATGTAEGCIVGLDYYRGNERVVSADGSMRDLGDGERRGFAAVAREYYEHLQLPFMLAETNAVTDVAPAWLAATWNDALALRAEGLPIRGYCWYSLTDQVDWDTCLRVPAGHVDSVGLVDLERVERPVGTVYRQLAASAARGVLAPIGIMAAQHADPVSATIEP